MLALQLPARICQKSAICVEKIHSDPDFARLEAKFGHLVRDLVFAGPVGVFAQSVCRALNRRSNGHLIDLGNLVALVGCRKPKVSSYG